MDMCYDGALVMPSSYAMMDEEEMSYVEGGLAWWAKTAIIAGVVACGIGLVVALSYGQVWLAATIMSKTIGAYVDLYGAAAVVPFVVSATGISATAVSAAVVAILRL